ncbi:NAD(P)H-binding protein [Noviherbaspirillum sp. 1P10PC]|uniref:NAD(P)H-binding protein n=1 Tax=Noviherbaspirillum sp. 1P10PC TaxID=3132292 RepID=UPI00399F0BD5
MIILLTGASGFIGRHLVDALLAQGHEVIVTSRKPGHAARPGLREVEADFSRDIEPAAWLPRLLGIDVVINAVGILRESPGQRFELLHERAPCALFAACAEAGVRLVIQLSALGADQHATSRYHLSKKAADDCLRRLGLPAVILQPSLVYGADGASATLFSTLASLPLVVLPGGGHQGVQPVHVDDLCALVLAVLAAPPASVRTITVAGAQPVTLRAMLAGFRAAMGLGRLHVLPLPMPLARMAASAGTLLPGSLLDADTLAMLERGNTGEVADMTAVLGHAPRPLSSFITPAEAPAVRLRAQLNWLLPVLRWSIALVWIVTGIVSLGLYPVQESYALLARTGITGALAPLMLYGAALMDLAFGIGTLALKRRRWLWLLQLALILFYTIVISFRLPEFWLHPYGPLLKNLPMLAAIWLLYELEK